MILMKTETMVILIVTVISALLIAGCTQSQPVPQTQQPTSVQPTTVQTTTVQPPDSIKLVNSQYGKILVDANGTTLYFFTKDIPNSGNSSCSGACAAIWPAFNVQGVIISVPLSLDDFRPITRADGTKQITFMGRPLYYYSNDLKPGDTNGQGFNNLWYVANVSGQVPIVTTPVATVTTLIPTTKRTTNASDYNSGSSSSGGGGGGY